MTTEVRSKREAILAFAREFYQANGYPAGIRDMQEGCGISSTSVVFYHLSRLVQQSRIETVDRGSTRIYMPADWRDLGRNR